jgi:hypothetical protein
LVQVAIEIVPCGSKEMELIAIGLWFGEIEAELSEKILVLERLFTGACFPENVFARYIALDKEGVSTLFFGGGTVQGDISGSQAGEERKKGKKKKNGHDAIAYAVII